MGSASQAQGRTRAAAACRQCHGPRVKAVFSFLYLKKIKFQKYMSVLKYFKNIPRSPSHRATGPMCNFFSNLQRSPWRKKKEGGLSPPQRATGPCRPPNGRQGPVFQPHQQSLLNFIKFLQRPKIYCDIFAEGFGNRVRIIMKFTEGVGCQFWWAMRPLKDDTRETTFHVISNYKLFYQRGCLVDADFTNL